MSHYRIPGLLLVLLFPAAPLSAQVHSPSQEKWEVSLSAGVSNVKDKSAATATAGLDTLRLVRLDYDSGYLVGLRITENLGRHFGAELEYSLANQPMAFHDLRPGLPRIELGHRIHSLNYSVLYYPLPRESRLRPFAAFGLGVAFFQLDGDSREAAEVEGLALRDRWKLAGTFGGGLKYRVTRRLGIRFDIRDQLTGVPDYGLPKQSPSFQGNVGAGFNNEGTLTNIQVSAGVVFYWSGF
jgi:opacity protein-like surface antigen